MRVRPTAADSETTNVTTAATSTDASALTRTGSRGLVTSNELTARADASAAPRASARSASVAEKTGEVVTASSVDWTSSRSPAEPTTKTASGCHSLSSSVAMMLLGNSMKSAPSCGLAMCSTITPPASTIATTAASGSTMHTATSS
nr:hypothetical protein [Mycobacterium sp. IDR2000157661]